VEVLYLLSLEHELAQLSAVEISIFSKCPPIGAKHFQIGLSWVDGGNVAIAEFSPSLNFDIL
jgi:hypothetical protein